MNDLAPDICVCVCVCSAPLVVLVYTLVPLGFVKAFAKFDQLSEDGDLDTDGIRYGDVTEATGFDMLPYVCPTLRAAKREPGTADTARESPAGPQTIDAAARAAQGSMPREESKSSRVSRTPGVLAFRILSQLGFLVYDCAPHDDNAAADAHTGAARDAPEAIRIAIAPDEIELVQLAGSMRDHADSVGDAPAVPAIDLTGREYDLPYDQALAHTATAQP